MSDANRATVVLDDLPMTAAEAARFMRMSETWIRNSDVPAVRLGRRVVYLRSQCLAYMRARLTHVIADPVVPPPPTPSPPPPRRARK